jgi:glycosyltransferase involved in cell wall biosynthesis
VIEENTIRTTIVAPGPDSEGGIKSVVARIVPKLEDRDDIDVVWIASQRSGSGLAKVLCFVKGLMQALLRLPKTDVVHLHGSVLLSLFRKSAFIWLARLMRCRIIYHFHSPQTVFEQFFAKPGLARRYALLTLRQCDAIVVLSDTWETIVRKALPDARIVVIYNPVMDTHRPVADNRADSLDVLYLAHLIRRKGFDDLVKAFVEVVEQVPSARLVFCGSGETDYARDLARELGILDNLVFRGWIPETEIAGELSTAAVFCLPSYDEGLPMGILEAMSSGVAVVTTPVGGVPDVLTHERNALLVEPGDIADLGKQLARLLIDAELRERLAQEALQDSVAFRPDTIAKEWVGVYASVLRDPKEARP